jgi:hypothetical protein
MAFNGTFRSYLMSNGNIFISYRRDDTSGHAGRLYDRLKDRFPDRVVMDVTSIDLGEDFVEEIERQLGACVVFIELIGSEWVIDRAGRRRLDQPRDFVRLEVAIALRRAITVIPILVEGATMPDGSSLPEEIAPLTRHNALTITESDFDHDVERLIHRLESVFGPRPPAPPLLPIPRARKSHPGRVALLIGIAVVGLFIVGAIGLFVLVLNFSPKTDTGDSNPNSPAPANAEVYVDQIRMAKGDGGTPGETTTSFEPGDATIYCILDLNKAKAGTGVRFIWKAVDADGSTNKIIGSLDYTTNSLENRVLGHLTRPDDWPKGRYKVEVYINGAPDKTITFTVE